jgi:phage terminase large subunit-like protein
MIDLLKAAKAANELKEIADNAPLDFFRPSIPQRQVLEATEPIVLFRAGNQLGKTYVGAAECLFMMKGHSPYKDLSHIKPPITVWAIVHSWEQSKIIQQKIHSLIGKNEYADDSPDFQEGRGYRAKNPWFKLKNGSMLYFKTANQGTLGASAGTIDYCWIDEPCPQSLFGELAARLLRKRGRMLMTMTPIGGGDLTWLKRLTETKPPRIRDIHAALTVENTTPMDLDGTLLEPLLQQADIDRIADTYLSIDRAARLEGSWDVGVPLDGRIFEHFGENHISDAPCPTGEYWFSIGIDHGHHPNAQCAILVAISKDDRSIYVLDEYFAAGGEKQEGTARRHARAIIAMIRRNGLEPLQIDRWTGDRPHGGGKHGGRMSNSLLRSALEHVLDYPQGLCPFRINTAHKPRWSVYYGCQLIHEAQVQGRFQVHPKCKRVIRSLSSWTLKKSGAMDRLSEWKHAIDSLRYACVPILDAKYSAPKFSKIPISRK